MLNRLSEDERKILLDVARKAIDRATRNQKVDKLEPGKYSKALNENGASFVTLTRKKDGSLRGCIGTLEAYQPLVLDVQTHAVAAALEDYRFQPVKFQEVADLIIEISRLTQPIKIKYDNPLELAVLIKPGVDGVILRDGFLKATFLPQVWDQLPEPREFLSHLCQKMGVRNDHWKSKILDVSIYQVEEFHE